MAEDCAAAGSDLAARLELTFRLLGKRIYRASERQLHADPDKASVPLLAVLEEHDSARPSDVAAAVELDLSTVSRQLRQLERIGLVSRRPDGDDGRACRISLTARGSASLARVRASRAAMLDEVFSSWPDTERVRLQHLLDRLLAGLAALPPAASASQHAPQHAPQAGSDPAPHPAPHKESRQS
jgi:DNA-binding MarR family transcriptional regulator